MPKKPLDLLSNKISVFNNSYTPEAARTESLEKIFKIIKSSKALKEKIEYVRTLDGDEYKEAKKHLKAVTFTGAFEKRTLGGLKKTSGLISLDIDHIDINKLKKKLVKDDLVFAFFISPSHNGLKVLIRADFSDDESYKAAWLTAEKHFFSTYKIEIDPSCKDICRLCFLSHDPDLYLNLNSKKIKIDAKLKEKPVKKEQKKAEIRVSDNKITEFILRLYENKNLSAGEGRSKALLQLGFDCYAWGLEKDEALELAYNINSKFDTPESDSIVKHQIESAYRYSRQQFGEYKRELDEKSTKKDVLKYFYALEKENQVRDQLKNFIYVAGADRLINKETGFELTTKTQMDNFLYSKTAGNFSISLCLKKGLIEINERMAFNPKRPRHYTDEAGVNIYNRFEGLKEITNDSPDDEAINMFLDHLRYLTTSEYEYKMLLSYIAYNVQNPGKKIMFCPLIISNEQGVGKSILELFFRKIFVSNTGRSFVKNIDNEALKSDFNDFMADKLIGFVHELDHGDRFKAMNRIKTLITETHITINGKHAKTYETPNTCNLFLFSNEPDAIQISKNDRRLLVIYCDKMPKSDEYYQILADTIEESYSDIYNYLMNMNLKDFNPYKRPEITEGKKQLIDQSKNELTLYLERIRDQKDGPFKNNFVTVEDIQNQVESWGPATIRQKTGQKAIKNFLILDRYKKETINKRTDAGRIHRVVWYKDELNIDEVINHFTGEMEKTEEKF